MSRPNGRLSRRHGPPGRRARIRKMGDTRMTDTTDAPVPAPRGPVYVGMGVAQDKPDLARTDAGRGPGLRQRPGAGVAAVVELLSPARPAVIVVEATGGLERPLPDALPEAGLPAAPVHPGRVRYFAQGLGAPAKTDRIDAGGCWRSSRVWPPRASRRNARQPKPIWRPWWPAAGSSPAPAPSSPTDAASSPARPPGGRSTRCWRRWTGRSNRSTSGSATRSTPTMTSRRLDTLLRSVPGVGPVLSDTLAAEPREPGRADRRRVGALVGVALFDCDSPASSGAAVRDPPVGVPADPVCPH